MTKIDIFSGFLGAGKTTLIKKMLKEAYAGEKVVLIENEFGEIGIDGGFMQDAGIQVTEMNSGCICCSLVGDFGKALHQVINEYAPDRILIEPSGVGKLSDIIRAVQNVAKDEEVLLNGFTTVCDAKKCKMHMKNFGEFFNDQIANAGCIVLSHSQFCDEEKLTEVVALLREKNATATIVTTPWDNLDGKQLLVAMERKDTIQDELNRLAEEADDDDDEECDDPECECHHHHHHHDDDEEHECCHHHHHHHDDDDDDDEDEHDHEHEEDDDDEDEDHDHECGCHHHHHEEGHECCHHHHGEGHHHHHHHHDADEVFVSCGAETPKAFDEKEMESILEELKNTEKYGIILRSKGIVASKNGSEWIHFDYIPEESNVRHGSASVIGRICVIGSHINTEALSALFGVHLE